MISILINYRIAKLTRPIPKNQLQPNKNDGQSQTRGPWWSRPRWAPNNNRTSSHQCLREEGRDQKGFQWIIRSLRALIQPSEWWGSLFEGWPLETPLDLLPWAHGCFLHKQADLSPSAEEYWPHRPWYRIPSRYRRRWDVLVSMIFASL